MTQEQYRNQFEDQVKDLIGNYFQIHGNAPAVTVNWGNGAHVQAQMDPVEKTQNPLIERLRRDISDSDSELDERSWGMQNGILISKEEAQYFVALLANSEKRRVLAKNSKSGKK